MLRNAMAGAATFALVLAAVAGCGDDDSNFIPFKPDTTAGTDTIHFEGFLATGFETGALEIFIHSQSLAPSPFRTQAQGRVPQVPDPTVAATGILKWSGGDVALTGSYDFTADTLYLAGSGRELRGLFVGSGGSGFIRGSGSTPSGLAGFVAARDSLLAFRPWLGTFHSADLADSGTICFVRAGTFLSGQAFCAGAAAGMLFQGSVAGSGEPRSFTFDGTLPTMFDLTGSGSLNEVTAGAFGTYDLMVSGAAYGSSSAGTWSAVRH